MATEPLVHSEHPELHHYTDLDGLRGIWTSGELWATHFQSLNDTSEVVHAKRFLAESVTGRLLAHIIIKSNSDIKLQTKIKSEGATSLAKHDAELFIDTLYNITYNPSENIKAPFASPFITSFCSHKMDDKYIQNDGLLSQWRGYGGRGTNRYAIVFDTKKLSTALSEDAHQFDHTYFSMLDVIYDSGLRDFRDRFNDEIRTIFHAVRDATFEPDFPTLKEVYVSFIKTTTRFKHRSFAEEREVRIVYSPALAEMRNFLEKKGAPGATARLRKIYSRENGAECVHLLEASQGARQAITRIIIGPSANIDFSIQAARELVGEKVPIHISETPYIG